MKVYVVYSILENEDGKMYDLDWIFEDKEKAKKYVDNKISPECYEIDEWGVDD